MHNRNKRKDRQVVSIILLTLLAIFALSSQARAYVDPGTGSYILQMVIAGLLGSLFTIKLFGKRIRAFLQKRFSGGESGQEDDSAGEDD